MQASSSVRSTRWSHYPSARAAITARRLPDALVLATAEVDDADVLTADRRWSAYSARVTVLG